MIRFMECYQQQQVSSPSIRKCPLLWRSGICSSRHAYLSLPSSFYSIQSYIPTRMSFNPRLRLSVDYWEPTMVVLWIFSVKYSAIGHLRYTLLWQNYTHLFLWVFCFGNSPMTLFQSIKPSDFIPFFLR